MKYLLVLAALLVSGCSAAKPKTYSGLCLFLGQFPSQFQNADVKYNDNGTVLITALGVTVTAHASQCVFREEVASE